MAEKTTTGLGFEQKIWNAACVLRGNMDAAEYKHVILGLIFLKYISDRFMEKYAALVAEGKGRGMRMIRMSIRRMVFSMFQRKHAGIR